jgi:hypothetical protein
MVEVGKKYVSRVNSAVIRTVLFLNNEVVFFHSEWKDGTGNGWYHDKLTKWNSENWEEYIPPPVVVKKWIISYRDIEEKLNVLGGHVFGTREDAEKYVKGQSWDTYHDFGYHEIEVLERANQ